MPAVNWSPETQAMRIQDALVQMQEALTKVTTRFQLTERWHKAQVEAGLADDDDPNYWMTLEAAQASVQVGVAVAVIGQVVANDLLTRPN